MFYVAKKTETRTPANLALAAELRAEAAAVGLTHKQLAEAAGIPYGNIVKTMSAARHTTAGELLQLAVALNLTPEDLTTRVVARMGGIEVLKDYARRPLSVVPSNVTNIRPDTTGEIEGYQGASAAYRDEEADTDEPQ